MGRELQKKKNRSSVAKVTRRKNPRIHKIKHFGNEIIAANWDKTETLAQNYKRLGLSSRLNASTWCPPEASAFAPTYEANERQKKAVLHPGEARIVRDEDGNVTVIHAPTAEEALTEDDDAAEEEEAPKTEVVRQLEAIAASEVKKERTQSDREKEWVQRLVQKYDHDWAKMARDRKLNPFQQTAGDIKRRVMKWEKENGSAKE